jgi:hypothetical protein
LTGGSGRVEVRLDVIADVEGEGDLDKVTPSTTGFG